MLSLTLALFVGFAPYSAEAVEDVDLIELNHWTTESGQEFHQIILWDWDHLRNRYTVVAWRRHAGELIDQVNGRFILHWDGRLGRIIRADHYRETRTRHDPEQHDQRHRPIYLRRHLWPTEPDPSNR